METINVTDFVKHKKHERSKAYPSYSLSFCFDLVKKIHTQFGASTFSTRQELSKVLGIPEGTIQTQLSAAGYYRLLDSKNKEGYKPSANFIKINKPLNDDEKRAVQIACISSPELYIKLINFYSNDVLPTPAALATILFRSYGISESASEKAATIFHENITSLGLLDADNHLRLDKIEDGEESEEQEENGSRFSALVKNRVQQLNPHVTVLQRKDTQHEPPVVQVQNGGELLQIAIPLKENRKAILYYPDDISNDDLDKITRFIDALRE